MHSSERIEDVICELEGYRWDALLLCKKWMHDKADIWETHHKHMFIANTCSWVQENMTTNTALVSY